MTYTFPTPNVINPTSVTAYRWGIMGAAGIAESFVAGVQKHTAQQIVAVASRTPGKAEEFAKNFGIENHDNYEDLLAREDIDVRWAEVLVLQAAGVVVLALLAHRGHDDGVLLQDHDVEKHASHGTTVL